jgi:multiple sugar transport system substrate-binding protein
MERTVETVADREAFDRPGARPVPLRVTRRGLVVTGGVLAGAAGVLAACGMPSTSQPQPGAAATGVVNVLYYTSTEPATARMQRQEAAIRQALPSLNTTMIPTPDIVGKFTTMSAGGDPPDLCWTGIEVAQHAAAGLVMAVDDLIARDRGFPSKEYYPQTLDSYKYKERTWGLPYGVTTHVIAYNKGLFDKSGVKYPTKDWTMQDFVATARRLVSSPNAETPVWGGWITHLYTAIWMHGGQVYDRGFTKSVLDQPQALSAFQFYYDQGFGSMKIAPTSNTSHRANLNPSFGDGQLAMVTMSPFVMPVLRERYPSVDWDLVTVPWNTNRTRGTWLSAEGFSLSSGTKNKDGAWAVLKQIVGKESQTSFYAPELASIPSYRSVAESTFISAVPGKQARTFLDSIEFATLWGGHPIILKTDVPVGEAWTEVREGRKSVRDGAAEAAQKLNDLLKQLAA